MTKPPLAFDKLLGQFDYSLPPRLIAQAPAKPRDSARLFVCEARGKKTKFDVFANVGKHLPKNAVLVFNQTKVWPARLTVKKPSGGQARLLYISNNKTLIKALSDRRLLTGGIVNLLPGRSKIGQKNRSPGMKVIKKSGQFYHLKPSFPISDLPDILKKYGATPLPPYIKHSPLTEKQRREQYQTVFAKSGLSVAAPTASLHFTKSLIAKLEKQGIGVKFISLDVGLGTFAPLREDNLKTGKLHREFYEIDKGTAEFLNTAKKQGRPIIAVGTTALRTLESSAGSGLDRCLRKLTGSTELFIRPGYKFRFVDGLITNFHVPKSSLMMLVASLVGKKRLLKIYSQAIHRRFRFFSFGDGMLILPH